MKSYFKKHIKALLRVKYRRYMSNFKGISNLFSFMGNYFGSSSGFEKRILIIYDLSVQPFSIGDLLLAQEVGLILCAEKKVNNVDVAILLTSKKPTSNDIAFESINSENYLYHFSALFPVLQMNKKLGSVFIFNSTVQLTNLVKHSNSYLKIWPSVKDIFLTKSYLHYIAFDEIIFPHWNNFKELPNLEPIGYLNDWAENFINKFCNGKTVVTINFRNNKLFQNERNLDVEIWHQFFYSCIQKKNVIFLIVCAKNEIDDRLRSCSNVIFAKDYDTTIEQDLALISAGDIHMGSSSGPASVAWFSNNKPYFIVRFTLSPNDFETPCLTSTGEDGYYKFCFSSAFQTFFSGSETVKILILKLEEMLCVVSPKNRKWKIDVTENQSWLR